MKSDEWLMQRVQRGDDGALTQLFERYRGPLFGFLAQRVGDAAADDLFQETWIRVARARASFDPKKRFSTWLFQIANNLCRDRGRRTAVQRKHRDNVLLEHRNNPVPAHTAPTEDRLDVHRRLAQLPDKLREVIVLRYYHQFVEREIAEILEIAPGTVKSRLHTALKALRGQEGICHVE